ncbi:MAG: hypothetical protein ACI4L9_05170 [Candidatus Coproplasma sp.]
MDFFCSNINAADKYIYAAFNTTAQNTTNNIRCAVSYSYSYNSYLKTGTAYTAYGSMNPERIHSSLLAVSSVTLDGDIVFLPD